MTDAVRDAIVMGWCVAMVLSVALSMLVHAQAWRGVISDEERREVMITLAAAAFSVMNLVALLAWVWAVL